MTKPVVRAMMLTVYSEEGPLLVHALRTSHKFSDPTVTSFAPQPHPLVVAIFLVKADGVVLLPAEKSCRLFGIHRGAHVRAIRKRRDGAVVILDFTMLLTGVIHKSMMPFLDSDSVRSLTIVRPISHDERNPDEQQANNQGG